MARPFPVPITLSDEDRQVLTGWSVRPKTAQALALRARISLAVAESESNTSIAKRLGTTPVTVVKWRGRFAARGLSGLQDEPRPDAPRTVTDAHVEQVITPTLESTPADATRWSTRRLRRAPGPEPVGHLAHLESLRTAAASERSVQALAWVRSSSRRCATSWAYTWRRPSVRWCCASTRRARSRPSTAPSRACP